MIQLSIPPPRDPAGDKRQHRRVPRELAVKYRSIRSDEWVIGKSADISVGGLFIAAPEPPRVGAEIACELSLDGSVVLKGTGTVRWHKAGPVQGFGVQFGSLDEATHARILKIIESYVTGEVAPVAKPAAPTAKASRRNRMWVPVLLVAVLAAGLGWWLTHRH